MVLHGLSPSASTRRSLDCEGNQVLAFPFLVVLLIPFRFCLRCVFMGTEPDGESSDLKQWRLQSSVLLGLTAPKWAKTCQEWSQTRWKRRISFSYPAAADCPIHPKMSALSIPGQVATIHCDQVATIPCDYITRLVWRNVTAGSWGPAQCSWNWTPILL